ncbi:amino acid adenylation domain-containing protein [Microbulbifer sp. OS29]|uniref:Amino acid adenylation domain-containing protein n=1 Tax=Microbulbifer okhotskensis TaxID=2926617 RepID=A0A9X2J571_9GAMM|nr:non-ribosomal peptide synthetase [Microbulbifer okhotskensis]MCO1334903.1 amino acid adenylation domain-containing protein [Microbulbifer okhotskensis]
MGTQSNKFYPLTTSQLDIFYHQQQFPDYPLYNICGYTVLRGRLNVSLLRRIYSQLSTQYDAFALNFKLQDGRPVQFIGANGPCDLELVNFSNDIDPEKTAKRYLESLFKKTLSIDTDCLVAMKLLRLSENEHWLVTFGHHLVIDGWAGSNILHALGRLYSANVTENGSSDVFEQIVIEQFLPTISEDAEYKDSSKYSQSKKYWLGKFPVIPEPLLSRRVGTKRDGVVPSRKISQKFDKDRYESIIFSARALRVTPQQLVIAAIYLYFSRVRMVKEIVLGMPVHNRGSARYKKIVGMFASSTPLKLNFDSHCNLENLISGIAATQRKDLRHQRYPISHLNRDLNLSAKARSRIHDINFNYLKIDYNSSFEGVEACSNYCTSGYSQIPLSINLIDFGGKQDLELQLEYNLGFYDDQVAKQLLDRLVWLSGEVPNFLAKPISEVDIISRAESSLLNTYSGIDSFTLPPLSSIVEEFSKHAAAYKDKLAVVCGDLSVTYGELEARSNQLCRMLQDLGVVTEIFVGICVSPSIEMLVSILGVIKAGGAYVPIDPDFPEDRVEFIVNDSEIKVLICDQEASSRLNFQAIEQLVLDSQEVETALKSYEDTAIDYDAKLESLVYMVYTSGSTGRPKGVLTEHAQLASYLAAIRSKYLLPKGLRYAVLSSIATDLGNTSLYLSLVNGGCIHILDKTIRVQSDELSEYLINSKIDLLKITPSHFDALFTPLMLKNTFDCSWLLLGGEVISPNLYDKIQSLVFTKKCNVINHYGPTETTIGCTTYQISDEEIVDQIPIGRPLPNRIAYILDDNSKPLPIGEVGELYIGGDGVGRGYHRQSSLTAEKFLPDTLSGRADSKLYKTGDLAQFLPDGNIVFVGRKDNQVKIRGYRIELEEIEWTLSNLPAVDDAAVVTYRGNNGRSLLIAYLVLSESVQKSEALKEIKISLKELLPSYMLPSQYRVMKSLPLTPNGKIDRKNLPDPGSKESNSGAKRIKSDVEQKLSKIWAGLFGKEEIKIGVNDNFFELGGDSILAIQCVSRAREAGIAFTVKDLFDTPSVQEIAKKSEQIKVLDLQIENVGIVNLLPIHHRFFELSDEINHYNQSVLLESPSWMDVDILHLIVGKLYFSHDALRLVFEHKGGLWQGKYKSCTGRMVEDSIEAISCEESDVEGHIDSLQRSFNLVSGPLFKAVLFKLSTGQNRLLLVAHHGVVDGMSWRILLEDIEQLCRQFSHDTELRLPDKTSSYKAWSEYLYCYASSDKLKEEVECWLHQVSGVATRKPIPLKEFSTRKFSIGEEYTEKLIGRSNKAYRTKTNELLLAALFRAFKIWDGRESLTLTLEGHGREGLESGLDLSRTVGWFTVEYPLTIDFDGESVESYITTVKNSCRKVPENGIGYGVIKYLSEISDLKDVPTPEILFNYLGQFDQVVNNNHLFSMLDCPGDMVSPFRPQLHGLIFNAIVNQGQLNFELSYIESVYKSEIINSLCMLISRSIEEVVEHCCNEDSGYFTISDFPLLGKDYLPGKLSQIQLNKWQTSNAIADLYPATSMQGGLLFHGYFENDAYIGHKLLRLEGDIDQGIMQQACQLLIDAEEVLRTQFMTDEYGEIYQLIQSKAILPWHFEDLSDLDNKVQKNLIKEFRELDKSLGFDIEVAPLIRIAFWHLGHNQYQLLWTQHHATGDGWSSALMFNRLINNYQYLSKQTNSIYCNSVPYKVYLEWLFSQDKISANHFWKKELGGINLSTSLPNIKSLKNQSDKLEIKSVLTETKSQNLSQLAKNCRVTFGTLIQGAWALLLSRYSNEEEVIFGVTVSGRPADLAGVENIVGPLINTLPSRVRLPDDQKLGEWLRELQSAYINREQYSYLSLPEILQAVNVKGGKSPFDSIVVVENYPITSSSFKGESSKEIQLVEAKSFEETNYGLALVVTMGDEVGLSLKYHQVKIDDVLAKSILDSYQNLLVTMCQGSEITLSSLTLLSKEDQLESILDEGTVPLGYPAQHYIHHLIEKQVEFRRDEIALTCGGNQLTYLELNTRANQLARYLKERGANAEVLIGVYLERSIDMVVALLAILKASAAYVPIDPNYPRVRVKHIIEDSGLKIMVSDQDIPLAQEIADLDIIRMDSCKVQEELYNYSKENLDTSELKPESLAYVIYTSGSTGLPKGVLVEHGNVVRLFNSTNEQFQFCPDDVWTMCHSFAFDFSVWEIWGALNYGGRLVIVSQETSRSYDDLYRLLIEEQVTVLNQTPGSFYQLAHIDEAQRSRLCLRFVIFGGEALNLAALKPWVSHRGDASPQLVNMYGITETTVHVTSRIIKNIDIESARGSLIGSPISDLKLYIFDRSMNLLPPGAIGEMYVGGNGVSRGYLNRDALTSERFCKHPLIPDMRLYKTGDLARIIAGDEIEYLGRIDNQIKIRGFRIELGEIEQQILTLAKVKSAVVNVCSNDLEDTYLVAYVCLDKGQKEISLDDVRQYLRERLPEYMQPSFYMELDQIPLTANGKVDRKSLPQPERAPTGSTYKPPQGDIQFRLVKLWADLLRLPVSKIGRNAHFFALGGHSLLSVRLATAVRNEFDVELEIREIFEYAELSEQAERISSSKQKITRHNIISLSEGRKTLSFSQQRLWFIDSLEGESSQYNLSGAFLVQGNFSELAAEEAFFRIISRHHSLRSVFIDNGQGVEPYVKEVEFFRLRRMDIRGVEGKKQNAEIERLLESEETQSFNLSSDLMLRAGFIRIKDNEGILFISMHHIASDGWSVGILLEEFSSQYQSVLLNKKNYISPLPFQYVDFAHWQIQQSSEENFLSQLGYWDKQLKDLPPVHNLPLDFPRPSKIGQKGAKASLSLKKAESEMLKAFALEQDVTLFMLIHAAFSLIVARHSNQQDIVVGTPVAGRRNKDLERMIGLFVNTLVLRVDCELEQDLPCYLEQIKRVNLEAQDNQDIPFEHLVERLNPERSTQYSPLFQILFTMDNTDKVALQLPSLTVCELERRLIQAKFELCLNVCENKSGLEFELIYNSALFKEDHILQLSEQLLRLLVSLPTQKNSRLIDLPFVDSAAENILKGKEMSLPEGPVQSRFEKIAKRQPDLPALIWEGQSISYGELNAQANKLAHLLRKKGIGPEERVGLCLKRGPLLIIALLATLKAGGAYVPLDPAYPNTRLAFMLEDSGVKLILGESHSKEVLKGSLISIIWLDEFTLSEFPNEEPLSLYSSHHLVYLIYTSGSTGTPKGVMVEHRSLLNVNEFEILDYELGAGDRILHCMSFNFDPATSVLFSGLNSGATIYLADTHSSVTTFIKEHELTHAILPAAVLAAEEEQQLPSLKMIGVGGEVCPLKTVQYWSQGRKFFNLYGPTECTVTAVRERYTGTVNKLTIGRPIANTYCYVLDDMQRPVPPGAVGELYIGGLGLARGYHGCPEQNTLRFIDNPISTGEKLYRTGDMVRQLADGKLEFLGRIDEQVKLRGFRIELGEIESILLGMNEIEAAAVVTRDEFPGQLVAYICLNSEFDTDEYIRIIQSELASKLPSYMLPAAYSVIGKLPLTINGKLDKNALPTPSIIDTAKYIAPATSIEIELAKIWAQLLRLKLDDIGVNDSFFALGGHSILAIKLVNSIERVFSITISLKKVFELSSLSNLSAYIESIQSDKSTKLSDVKKIQNFSSIEVESAESIEEFEL